MKIKKILIVADDSESSIKAIQYGFDLARTTGAIVMLLSVIEPEMAAGNPDAGIFPDDALVALKSKMEKFLNHAKVKYGKKVNTDLQVPTGDIQATVVDTAVTWRADLIVTGTHNRTGISKLFNGSVSDSIIHHAPVPVCVVPLNK
jgi:nucleotide-binding universal stress UspA family protein